MSSVVCQPFPILWMLVLLAYIDSKMVAARFSSYVSEFEYLPRFHPSRNPDCPSGVHRLERFSEEEFQAENRPFIEIKAVLVDCSNSLKKRKHRDTSGIKNCTQKIIINVKFNNVGKTKTEEEFVVVDHILDTVTMKKLPLQNPYVIKVRQEPVLQLYGLRFQSVVNAEAKEEVINNKNYNFTGCNDGFETPTCGQMFVNGEPIPYSQGFCCSCDPKVNEEHQYPESKHLQGTLETGAKSNCNRRGNETCNRLQKEAVLANLFHNSKVHPAIEENGYKSTEFQGKVNSTALSDPQKHDGSGTSDEPSSNILPTVMKDDHSLANLSSSIRDNYHRIVESGKLKEKASSAINIAGSRSQDYYRNDNIYNHLDDVSKSTHENYHRNVESGKIRNDDNYNSVESDVSNVDKGRIMKYKFDNLEDKNCGEHCNLLPEVSTGVNEKRYPEVKNEDFGGISEAGDAKNVDGNRLINDNTLSISPFGGENFHSDVGDKIISDAKSILNKLKKFGGAQGKKIMNLGKTRKDVRDFNAPSEEPIKNDYNKIMLSTAPTETSISSTNKYEGDIKSMNSKLIKNSNKPSYLYEKKSASFKQSLKKDENPVPREAFPKKLFKKSAIKEDSLGEDENEEQESSSKDKNFRSKMKDQSSDQYLISNQISSVHRNMDFLSKVAPNERSKKDNSGTSNQNNSENTKKDNLERSKNDNSEISKQANFESSNKNNSESTKKDNLERSKNDNSEISRKDNSKRSRTRKKKARMVESSELSQNTEKLFEDGGYVSGLKNPRSKESENQSWKIMQLGNPSQFSGREWRDYPRHAEPTRTRKSTRRNVLAGKRRRRRRKRRSWMDSSLENQNLITKSRKTIDFHTSVCLNIPLRNSSNSASNGVDEKSDSNPRDCLNNIKDGSLMIKDNNPASVEESGFVNNKIKTALMDPEVNDEIERDFSRNKDNNVREKYFNSNQRNIENVEFLDQDINYLPQKRTLKDLAYKENYGFWNPNKRSRLLKIERNIGNNRNIKRSEDELELKKYLKPHHPRTKRLHKSHKRVKKRSKYNKKNVRPSLKNPLPVSDQEVFIDVNSEPKIDSPKKKLRNSDKMCPGKGDNIDKQIEEKFLRISNALKEDTLEQKIIDKKKENDKPCSPNCPNKIEPVFPNELLEIDTNNFNDLPTPRNCECVNKNLECIQCPVNDDYKTTTKKQFCPNKCNDEENIEPSLNNEPMIVVDKLKNNQESDKSNQQDSSQENVKKTRFINGRIMDDIMLKGTQKPTKEPVPGVTRGLIVIDIFKIGTTLLPISKPKGVNRGRTVDSSNTILPVDQKVEQNTENIWLQEIPESILLGITQMPDFAVNPESQIQKVETSQKFAKSLESATVISQTGAIFEHLDSATEETTTLRTCQKCTRITDATFRFSKNPLESEVGQTSKKSVMHNEVIFDDSTFPDETGGTAKFGTNIQRQNADPEPQKNLLPNELLNMEIEKNKNEEIGDATSTYLKENHQDLFPGKSKTSKAKRVSRVNFYEDYETGEDALFNKQIVHEEFKGLDNLNSMLESTEKKCAETSPPIFDELVSFEKFGHPNSKSASTKEEVDDSMLGTNVGTSLGFMDTMTAMPDKNQAKKSDNLENDEAVKFIKVEGYNEDESLENAAATTVDYLHQAEDFVYKKLDKDLKDNSFEVSQNSVEININDNNEDKSKIQNGGDVKNLKPLYESNVNDNNEDKSKIKDGGEVQNLKPLYESNVNDKSEDKSTIKDGGEVQNLKPLYESNVNDNNEDESNIKNGGEVQSLKPLYESNVNDKSEDIIGTKDDGDLKNPLKPFLSSSLEDQSDKTKLENEDQKDSKPSGEGLKIPRNDYGTFFGNLLAKSPHKTHPWFITTNKPAFSGTQTNNPGVFFVKKNILNDDAKMEIESGNNPSRDYRPRILPPCGRTKRNFKERSRACYQNINKRERRLLSIGGQGGLLLDEGTTDFLVEKDKRTGNGRTLLHDENSRYKEGDFREEGKMADNSRTSTSTELRTRKDNRRKKRSHLSSQDNSDDSGTKHQDIMKDNKRLVSDKNSLKKWNTGSPLNFNKNGDNDVKNVECRGNSLRDDKDGIDNKTPVKKRSALTRRKSRQKKHKTNNKKQSLSKRHSNNHHHKKMLINKNSSQKRSALNSLPLNTDNNIQLNNEINEYNDAVPGYEDQIVLENEQAQKQDGENYENISEDQLQNSNYEPGSNNVFQNGVPLSETSENFQEDVDSGSKIMEDLNNHELSPNQYHSESLSENDVISSGDSVQPFRKDEPSQLNDNGNSAELNVGVGGARGAEDVGRDFKISLTGKIHVYGGTNGVPMSISFDGIPEISGSLVDEKPDGRVNRFPSAGAFTDTSDNLVSPLNSRFLPDTFAEQPSANIPSDSLADKASYNDDFGGENAPFGGPRFGKIYGGELSEINKAKEFDLERKFEAEREKEAKETEVLKLKHNREGGVINRGLNYAEESSDLIGNDDFFADENKVEDDEELFEFGDKEDGNVEGGRGLVSKPRRKLDGSDVKNSVNFPSIFENYLSHDRGEDKCKNLSQNLDVLTFDSRKVSSYEGDLAKEGGRNGNFSKCFRGNSTGKIFQLLGKIPDSRKLEFPEGKSIINIPNKLSTPLNGFEVSLNKDSMESLPGKLMEDSAEEGLKGTSIIKSRNNDPEDEKHSIERKNMLAITEFIRNLEKRTHLQDLKNKTGDSVTYLKRFIILPENSSNCAVNKPSRPKEVKEDQPFVDQAKRIKKGGRNKTSKPKEIIIQQGDPEPEDICTKKSTKTIIKSVIKNVPLLNLQNDEVKEANKIVDEKKSVILKRTDHLITNKSSLKARDSSETNNRHKNEVNKERTIKCKDNSRNNNDLINSGIIYPLKEESGLSYHGFMQKGEDKVRDKQWLEDNEKIGKSNKVAGGKESGRDEITLEEDPKKTSSLRDWIGKRRVAGQPEVDKNQELQVETPPRTKLSLQSVPAKNDDQRDSKKTTAEINSYISPRIKASRSARPTRRNTYNDNKMKNKMDGDIRRSLNRHNLNNPGTTMKNHVKKRTAEGGNKKKDLKRKKRKNNQKKVRNTVKKRRKLPLKRNLLMTLEDEDALSSKIQEHGRKENVAYHSESIGRSKKKRTGKSARRNAKFSETQIRGGQDCMERKHPPDVDPFKFLESAHCLRFSDLWYSVYQLEEPMIDYRIHLQIYEKRSLPDGSTSWHDLMRGSTIRLGTFDRYHRNPEDTIAFKYSEIKSMTSRTYNLDPSRHRLLIPSSVIQKKPKHRPNERRSSEYLVVEADKIEEDGSECDKAGVGFAAFAEQPDRCERVRGTCLKNQPLAYWRHDMEARESGRGGCYFLSNFASVPSEAIKYNANGTGSGGTQEFLALEHHSPHVSLIELQLKADYNSVLHTGSLGRITEVQVDNTAMDYTIITLIITNKGISPCAFHPRIINCPKKVPPTWLNAEGSTKTILPHRDRQITLDLFGKLSLHEFRCTVELLNHRNEPVATREIKVRRMDRCFCSWHCICSCMSDGHVSCRTMSLEDYHAAGFRGPIPTTESFINRDNIGIIIILALLLFLLFMGLLKWIVGFYVPAVSRWGLDSLIGTSKMLKYFEKELHCRCIVIDQCGAPVHPDTKLRTVRICNRKTEFWLNLTFFFTYPIVTCCSCCKKVCRTKPVMCKKESKIGSVFGREDDFKTICVSTYGECLNSKMEQEDTQYVLNELKKSQESLQNNRNRVCRSK